MKIDGRIFSLPNTVPFITYAMPFEPEFVPRVNDVGLLMYGPKTEYPVSMTYRQLMRFYWRPRRLVVNKGSGGSWTDDQLVGPGSYSLEESLIGPMRGLPAVSNDPPGEEATEQWMQGFPFDSVDVDFKGKFVSAAAEYGLGSSELGTTHSFFIHAYIGPRIRVPEEKRGVDFWFLDEAYLQMRVTVAHLMKFSGQQALALTNPGSQDGMPFLYAEAGRITWDFRDQTRQNLAHPDIVTAPIYAETPENASQFTEVSATIGYVNWTRAGDAELTDGQRSVMQGFL